MSDAQIHVIDSTRASRTFNVHKVIMVTSSPFFRQMFISNANENLNSVKIELPSHKTFDHILQFIYQGQLVIDESEVPELKDAMTTFKFIDMVNKIFPLTYALVPKCVKLN